MKLRALVLVFAGMLAVGGTARAEDCSALRELWQAGNYGMPVSQGWPARADGKPMSLVDADERLGQLRRQTLTLYSGFYSGDFIVPLRGGTRLKDALEQLGALQELNARQPTPRLTEQIHDLLAALGEARNQLASSPSRLAYEKLQALCVQARNSFRATLERQCGASAGWPGYELRNWEGLPDPPPLLLPTPPAPGSLPDSGPSPGPNLAPDSATPEATPTAGVNEENPLWSETPPPYVPAPEPTEAPAAALEWTPTPGGPAPATTPGSDLEQRDFLALIAQPDAGDALPLTPVVPREGLQNAARPDDFNLQEEAGTSNGRPAPAFEETTLVEAGVRPTPHASRPLSEEEKGQVYLFETFYRGELGPERVGGAWGVEQGVLRGRGLGQGASEESLYVLGRDMAWRNYEVQTDLSIEGGAFESGLLLRTQPPARAGANLAAVDGYVLRVRARPAPSLNFHDAIDLAVRRDGKLRNVVCGGGEPLEAHHSYQLTARLDFGELDVLVDGRPVLTCRDDSFASGGAMLRLAGNTAARFDNVLVREIPIGRSSLESPQKGVELDLPAPGVHGWGKLGGTFEPVGDLLLGEAANQGPALARHSLQEALRDAELTAEGDLTLSADVRAVGWQGGGGLLMGAEDHRYYAAVLRPVRGQAALAEVWLLQLAGDQWQGLARQTLALDVARWHRIALSRTEGSLEVLVDGHSYLKGKARLRGIVELGVFVDPGSRLLVDRLLVTGP